MIFFYLWLIYEKGHPTILEQHRDHLNLTVLTKKVASLPTPNPLFAPLDPPSDATKLNLQRLQLYKELEI